LVPLRRHFRRASTPSRARRLDFRHPGANQAARSVLVVSHHLDGLLRSTDSGVLQPVPARVRRVSSPSTLDPASWFEARQTLPRDAGTPRRTFIISSCTASLRPLPSCGCPSRPRSPSAPPKRTLQRSGRDLSTLHVSLQAALRVALGRLEPGLTSRLSEESRSTIPVCLLLHARGHLPAASTWEANFPICRASPAPKRVDAAPSPSPAEATDDGVDPLQGLFPLMTISQPLLVAELQSCFSSFHGLLISACLPVASLPGSPPIRLPVLGRDGNREGTATRRRLSTSPTRRM